MSKRKNAFEPIDPETQKDYQREVRLQYDPQLVTESVNRWSSYSDEKKQAIMDEGNAIYRDIAAAMEAGKSPDDATVQTLLERWQEHLNHFYEPTLDILRGLGQTYSLDARFAATFEAIHPQLPAYLTEAIEQYVDDLETAAIEQMLAEDEESAARRLSL